MKIYNHAIVILAGPPKLNPDNATYTLRYVNGTFCHRSQKARSTEITFYCGDDDDGPVFAAETEDCQYNFIWRTKAVCPPEERGTVGASRNEDAKERECGS